MGYSPHCHLKHPSPSLSPPLPLPLHLKEITLLNKVMQSLVKVFCKLPIRQQGLPLRKAVEGTPACTTGKGLTVGYHAHTRVQLCARKAPTLG